MGLFDAKQGVKQAGNTVSPEVAACDQKLAALAQQKRNAIYRVGELFVTKNNSSSVAGTEYEPIWKELVNLEVEMIALQKQKLAVQGLRKCEKCGAILPLDSVFCNKCGERQEEQINNAGQQQAVCPDCGKACATGTLFCTNCGKKLG